MIARRDALAAAGGIGLAAAMIGGLWAWNPGDSLNPKSSREQAIAAALENTCISDARVRSATLVARERMIELFDMGDPGDVLTWLVAVEGDCVECLTGGGGGSPAILAFRTTGVVLVDDASLSHGSMVVPAPLPLREKIGRPKFSREEAMRLAKDATRPQGALDLQFVMLEKGRDLFCHAPAALSTDDRAVWGVVLRGKFERAGVTGEVVTVLLVYDYATGEARGAHIEWQLNYTQVPCDT